MVNDQDDANYGEWDSYVSLSGLVSPGDSINVRYSQMYTVQGGEMRVAVVFYDAGMNPISAGSLWSLETAPVGTARSPVPLLRKSINPSRCPSAPSH